MLATGGPVGLEYHTPKGCGFDPWLGCVWEATDCFSVPLPLPSSLSLKLMKISLGED